ncbi:MAG: hypothetical protein O3A47_09790 [Chloroflexi bacterium]|nr:hypothetical protein [Chloroflexota bacterium]
MAKKSKAKLGPDKVAKNLEPRNWVFSILVAAVVVGFSVLLSATVNPIFDRSVHWDWMAGVAPASFAFLLVSIRRRWV